MQAPVSFYIHAKDSRDKKLEAGGDYVVVKVLPGNTAKATGARESEAIVKDNGDGSYTATYSVDARGDYEVISPHSLSPLLSTHLFRKVRKLVCLLVSGGGLCGMPQPFVIRL